MRAGARAAAEHLGMSETDTKALEERFAGYPHPVTGPNASMPPILITITKNSRDHNIEVYREVVIPSFEELAPSTKVRLIQLDAGVHSYWRPEADLPKGVAPVAAETQSRRHHERIFPMSIDVKNGWAPPEILHCRAKM